MTHKVRCLQCGEQDVDVVWSEINTFQALFDGPVTLMTGNLIELDQNGGQRDGYFCNVCGDYVDEDQLEPGYEIKTLEPGESTIDLVDGFLLVFPSDGMGVDYVRIVDRNNEELLYFDASEWGDEPSVVMGALLGAMRNPMKAKRVLQDV